MNKNVKKILLTILLTFTAIFAGKVLADNLTRTTEGKITVNKVASKDIGVEGNETYGRTGNVTLSVTGNGFTTSSSLDVVLVIDRSGSMNDKANNEDDQTKMQATKDSAITLATTLLANNTSGRTVVNMGIVTFGSDIILTNGDTINPKSLTSNNLTSNVTTITGMINNIPNSVGNRGDKLGSQGTNIQSGLEKAKELLADSTAKNKVVILLTDGKPTYFNYNGTRYGDGSNDGNGWRETPYCVEYTGRICTKELKPSSAAKEEADAIKNNGATIYTVGFGISSDTTTTEFLQNIATGTEKAYLADDAEELLSNFNDIVKSMTTIANDVIVEDIVPVGFEVDEVALKNTYGDAVTITDNADGTTKITWNIGTLSVTTDPVLTYQVTAKNDYYGGMYTNTTAILTGTAVDGNPSYPNGDIEEEFPMPIIAIPMVTNNNNYIAKLGETLTVTTSQGILVDDSDNELAEGENTSVENKIIIKSASCGSIEDITVNEDGSFTYVPNSTCYADKNEVVFTYEVKTIVTINGVEHTVISNPSTITIELTKDDSEIIDPVVSKTNNNGEFTTTITGPFDYTINYSTIIENHVGSTTVTIVDQLPYELDLTQANDLDGGTYDATTKTITWIESINNIDSYKNQNNSINIEKNITVFYKNVPTNIETIKNTASVTTDINNNPVTSEEETKIIRGTVITNYIDTNGNILLPNVTSEGLIDSEYKTNANNIVNIDGVEYQLVATKVNEKEVDKTNNYSGKYQEETTYVTYIYYKVTGDIDNEQTVFTKEGPEVVTKSDGEFEYTITYQSKIDNYIGNATVTIVDKLPYELDLTKVNISKDLDGGIYDATNKTITWVENITNIDTYTKGTYTVNITKNIKLIFKGIDATERTLVNKVEAKLETSKTEEETKTEEKTELAINGYVIAHYVDTNNKVLEESVETSGLVGNEYITTAKSIDDYKIVKIIGNTTGTYIDGTIEVTYVYYKVEGTILDDSITKDGTNEVTSTDASFEYDITYEAIINDYIGNATVTIVDQLPYELDLTKVDTSKDLDGGTYDATNKTITWVETINGIDTNKNDAYIVSITKNIKVVYAGIAPETREVTNSVVGTVKTEVTESTTLPVEKDTAVKVSGNVIAHYVDTNNKVLEENVETSGLVGNEYTTTAKTIDGYKLVETIGNTTGTYIDGTIEVTYVYYKVEGNITDSIITKTGTDEVTSTDASFEYTVTYKTVIEDYIGNATVTIVDQLPYELDLTKVDISKDLDDGIYDAANKTITWVETINEIDTNKNGAYQVEISKNIKVVYKGMDATTRKVINSVVGTIKTDIKEETTEPVEKETLVKVSGKVITNYVDTDGNILEPSISTSGLVGDDYVTSAKDISGYELVEIVGNTIGKYTAETIEVTYVYYKETGEIIGDIINKTGTDEVTSTDANFEYTITYNAIIKDYIGNATVTIVDTLPYELDLNKVNNLDGGTYDATSKTITWVETITGINTNKNGVYQAEIVKNIKVVYKDIDPTIRNVTNKVVGMVKTDVTEETTEPSEKDTAVKVSGNVIANYVDTNGNTISSSVETTGLVGNEYVTSAKEITGYELVKTNGNTRGTYIDGTIEVTYIYYKETGNITNDVVEKNGSKEIVSSSEKVNYTIKYQANIDNYIGEATVTIVDTLPYELDLTTSDLAGGIYDNETKTITWTITITNIDTYTNGTFEIDIIKELSLKYKEIDLTSDKITNKVSATVKTDVSESSDNDEFDTEVNVNGNVIVNYVDEQGNILSESIIISGKVGTTYETTEKDLYDYILINIEGETTGKYTEEEQVITYIYTLAGKGGDVEELPPQTGINDNSLINLLVTLILAMFVAIKRVF